MTTKKRKGPGRPPSALGKVGGCIWLRARAPAAMGPALDARARAEGRTPSEVIRAAVEAYLRNYGGTSA